MTNLNTPPAKKKRDWFLYVNFADYHGDRVTKVGYSCSPEKRLNAFNNGVRFRCKKGHLDTHVKFRQFFLIKLGSREECKRLERRFFRTFKGHVLSQFGREVVSLPPEGAASAVCALMERRHA